MFIPLIMAGGVGQRFWPCSRNSLPKQFLNVVSENTMIEDTVTRLSRLAPADRICIATTADQVPLINKYVPAIKKDNIIVEPCLRNTAPCIGLAAFTIAQKFNDKDAVVGVFPADHVIKDVAAFQVAVAQGMPAADGGKLVTFGIVPTAPETGYGYIKAAPDGADAVPVEAFVEKPDEATAREYLADGGFNVIALRDMFFYNNGC